MQCEMLSYSNNDFKDYICPEKRSSTMITIEHGDSFTYNTNPGGAAK